MTTTSRIFGRVSVTLRGKMLGLSGVLGPAEAQSRTLPRRIYTGRLCARTKTGEHKGEPTSEITI